MGTLSVVTRLPELPLDLEKARAIIGDGDERRSVGRAHSAKGASSVQLATERSWVSRKPTGSSPFTRLTKCQKGLPTFRAERLRLHQ